MASSLHSNLTFLHPFLKPNPITTQSTNFHHIPIRCGPRSNRGPLVKGRILSIEAIQAIQSLKRAQKTNSLSPSYPSLSRLLKADLLAALRELLRQGECAIGLHVFSVIRAEYPDQDLGLLADMISALGKNGMGDEIDRLIDELEEIDGGDEKGLLRVIKGVIGTGSKASTIRICEVMKRSGVGSGWKVDECVGKVLSKGLRGFGEFDLANEVEREFCWDFRGNLENSVV
ncbi:protein THYLAKOID ASSEMBLY 8, chloroplastic-like [Mangifera indica]|uniref:protein THYLAKOID ASSEMBLY 8, chloroplastic-like n=1 Tax=Mangifera indica TaxID=29780 RepID=UPI001CFA6DD9|nr:protein THYLAKOID ASSEMBLY 8, chloroplastic-like [Mangifera indica]